MRLAFTQEADFRQRRDFGQKFSATFDFIGAHWRGLGQALLYLVLPAAILQGIVTGLVQNQILSKVVQGSGTGTNRLRQMAMVTEMYQSPFYWANIVVSGIFIMLLVLTVYAYVKCLLRPMPSSEPISVRQVWEVVKQEFIGSYLSYFGLLFLVGIGFVFLAIPGFYLSVAFSLFYITKVVEGTGFGETCSRCLRLVRGKWWSTFGLMFLMTMMLGIALGVFGGVLSSIVYFLAGSFGLVHTSEAGSSTGLFTVIISALTGLLNMFIYPPLLLALAFQYFNLVERRDGTGLHQLVGQIGQAPAPVQNAALRPDEEGEY
ncbi:hypothetical protein GCM10022409_40680 [Hymenobacter glaciei]|uniref:Glycerophosphoryl diester phosphodiesterase membrane domain-containing protein n=1 Tax=Hymenobacter glaciei TaxID=877209 RepID=A0ABP7UQB0_9BACT